MSKKDIENVCHITSPYPQTVPEKKQIKTLLLEAGFVFFISFHSIISPSVLLLNQIFPSLCLQQHKVG